MFSNECVAMILAGGEGKRLAPLTAKLAKPAVPFGGRYRIIDFPLSNCKNSGIHSIGVLTQYRAESLHSHLEDGACWMPEEKEGRFTLLPPSSEHKDGYTGTADAIYKNIAYLDALQPENVLILSGDHIYNMDYRELLDVHTSTGAHATISVKEVPWKEAHRFGIMHTDEQQRVIGFEEKPAKPASNLASLGIYMFRWETLRDYLIEDAADAQSSHDFGKDIIPKMLKDQIELYACPFNGYWRDVGTVDSLWEAHMDLLDNGLTIDTDAWPMQTKAVSGDLASYRDPFASVEQSVIPHGCSVDGDLTRSVLFHGVQIGRGSEIEDSIIMPNVKIGRNVKITRAIIGEGSIIEDGTVIGSSSGEITVIGADELIFSTQPSSLKPHVLRQLYGRQTAVETAAAYSK
ncbi:glucose-1-phosphate adenylyltransferase [Paenibacillus daejeonensis]|uniref:glucose-1-phosphate adenylyltransferase n=1 Tax=Paenibacillus daejeonensis TaxID=135193 RepID=UPI000371DC36|nr:glucose-1-phosphate adenylyltransferase [Paenibacillus daejeonensis]